ncbi:MAG: hypothetical protein QM760_00655 [Nibricoccus sp.]
MRIPRIFHRKALGAVVAMLTFAPRIFSADPKPSASSEIVELPTLNVTDDRELPPPDKWRYTQIPGFEVISNASDRNTTRLLRDFGIFQIALDKAWPMEKRPMPPTAIILCGKEKTFDTFVTEGKTGPDRVLPSTLLTGKEQSFILIDLALKTVTTSQLEADGSSGQMQLQYAVPGARSAESGAAEAGLDASTDFEVDPYKQLYREYIRHLFAQDAAPPPIWLEEGVAQIVVKMKVTPKDIIFGELAETDTQGVGSIEDPDFPTALKRRTLLSFDEFFGVKRGDPQTLNTIGKNIWAKQCYAFVHLGLYGQNYRYKPAFEKLVARAKKEPVTPALFQECFGKPYEKFLVELSAYIQAPDYKHQQYIIKGKDRLTLPLPEMRDATEGESERIKGDALRVAGKPAAIRPSALAAYIRGDRDPQFLATFGQAELAGGDRERAGKLLAAAASKATRPSVLLDLAQVRYDAAIAKPAGAKRKFGEDQSSGILRPLITARTLYPSMPEVYRLIAQTWMQTEIPPKPESLVVLSEGLKIFPRDEALVYYTAALNLRLGYHQAALALVTYGEKIATSDTQRGQFARLKAQIPPPDKS